MGSAFGESAGLSGTSESAFGQVMGLVAATLGFFTLGAYLGRHLGEAPSWLFFFLAFGCIIGLNFTRENGPAALPLLFGTGLFLGLGLGGVLVLYAEVAPGSVWQAAAATALFIAGLGSIGFMISSDLSGGYRILFLLLLGLIIWGFISLFTAMPGGNVLYSVLGLGIFGGYTVLDFNRMRRNGMEEPVSIAAGVFLDVINVFNFFLNLFGRRDAGR